MVSEEVGQDIFKLANHPDVDALVNPVNCVGVMGKGLALHFKRRYPRSYWIYKDACSHDRVAIGRVLYVAGEGNEPNILHFPTKKHWRDKSELWWIEQGLRYIKVHHLGWHVSSIAMPMIGCGLGGLDWYDVRPLINEILGIPSIDVVLCIR
jgi:O-acetyl-ADP-ribose deacetylase (regulator of RNase III)